MIIHKQCTKLVERPKEIFATISFMPSYFLVAEKLSIKAIEEYSTKVLETVDIIFGKNRPTIGFMYYLLDFSRQAIDNLTSEYIIGDGYNIFFNVNSIYDKPPYQDIRINSDDIRLLYDYIANNIIGYVYANIITIYDLVIELETEKYSPTDLKDILNKMRLLCVKINSVIIYPDLEKKYPDLQYSQLL